MHRFSFRAPGNPHRPAVDIDAGADEHGPSPGSHHPGKHRRTPTDANPDGNGLRHPGEYSNAHPHPTANPDSHAHSDA